MPGIIFLHSHEFSKIQGVYEKIGWIGWFLERSCFVALNGTNATNVDVYECLKILDRLKNPTCGGEGQPMQPWPNLAWPFETAHYRWVGRPKSRPLSISL